MAETADNRPQVAKTKRPNTPKVRYMDKTYEIVGKTGNTIRVSDGFAEFCILAEKAKPTNKEARELYKNG